MSFSLKNYLVPICFLLVGILAFKSHELNTTIQKETPVAIKSNDKASNSRSDTIDILNYNISLDITNFANKYIKGNCVIKLVPKKNNISNLYFDLLKLQVDSVLIKGQSQLFSQNDTQLAVNLLGSIGILDTTDVEIFYQGKPVKDNSWGGFYFQNNHAFNLGVAFTDDPHNYGRVWFPCFDNFVERSTYTFNILTSNGKKAHCNGELISESVVGIDSVIRTWEMREEIPTYLACVAVAEYETVRWTYNGLNGVIPIEVAALASDTNDMKASFANLNAAMSAFESSFGPYLFNKVGYSIVPFNGGAMEHASNIAYPAFAINGNLSNETLMAHELAHHWWGDLVTCKTDGDMWINEGMASYCEHLFLEHVYGKNEYINAVQENLTNVLQYAHVREQQYRAITNLPHNYTYGMHTYDKGALVAHNLRYYLGDNDFFNGTTVFLNNHKFSDVTSTQLRDELGGFTGILLDDFFNDWVFNPGFPHFSVDSFEVVPTPGAYQITIHVRQKLKGTGSFFSNVPITVAAVDENYFTNVSRLNVNGEFTTLTLTTPTEPKMIFLNPDNALNEALTADLLVIKDTGSHVAKFGKVALHVSQLSDSAYLRIEHHWVAPDALKKPQGNLRMSDYRYWSIDGDWNNSVQASAEIIFDGRNMLSGGNGHLDYDLLRTGEDSLVLLYRKGVSDDWTEVNSYSINNRGTVTDRYGSILIDTLKKGEYALAKGEFNVGVSRNIKQENYFLITPNPSSSEIQINLKGISIKDVKEVTILNVKGQMVKKTNSMTIDMSEFGVGSYYVTLKLVDGKTLTNKFVRIN